MTANLYWRNDRAAETWSAIEAAQPDLVLLQEVSTRSGTFLPPSGWFARVFAHDADAFGTAVLSRLPVADTREVLIGGRGQLRTEVTLAGVRIVIWSVHPIAPVSRTKDRIWRTQLAEFGEHFASERGPLVVGGDLNATGDHHPFQELLRTTGLTDALPSSRRAWATWPARWSAFPPSPPRTMALDHVLVRGLAVTRVRRLAAGRSDHHPVCADLVLDSIIDVDVN